VAVLACGCSASYPTQPTAPTALALQLQLRSAFGRAVVGSNYQFSAYTLRSDTAWEDVTSNAEWRSSNIGVLRPSPNGSVFAASAPGTATVLVRYGGMVQSIDVEVIAAVPQTRPRLELLSLPQTLTVGGGYSLVWLYQNVSGASTILSTGAVVESSDHGVVAVNGNGLRGITPGTATISVSYLGLTEFFRVSVTPPR
jgi:hypothetical protein